MLNEALGFVKRGWPVFPLHYTTNEGCSCGGLTPKCTPGKHPYFQLAPNGVHSATLNEDEVRRVWLQQPKANIGIALGKVSGVVAVDIDKGATLEHVKKLFPRTPTAKTKNGFHVLLKYKDGLKQGPLPLPDLEGLPECEANLRSTGYYIVGVGSEIDGYEYAWLEDEAGERSPDECDFADAPDWITTDRTGLLSEVRNSNGSYNAGSRHQVFLATATAMRKQGHSHEEILAEISRRNIDDCNPPKPDAHAELVGIADYVWKHMQPDPEAVAKRQSEAPKRGRPKDKETAFEIAMHFRDFLAAEIKYHQKEYFLFKGKNYEVIEEDILEAKINRWLVDSDSETTGCTITVRQIMGFLKMAPHTLPASIQMPIWLGDELAHVPNLISLQNGILDVKQYAQSGSAELLPHSEKFFSRYVLPFEYDPNGKCPTFEAVALKALGTKEIFDLWCEILGVHLYTPFPIEKFFVLQGEGSNGKTVLITVLTALLGQQNISSVPLESFEPSNFSFATTYGKMANIVPDQHDIDNINEGMLKQFVTRELMTFNAKFRTPIVARPTAFLTICTNSMPRFVDRSDGIWRRLIMIPFKNQIAEKDQNTNLVSTDFWNTSGELSGIFNLALAGLLRVIERRALARIPELERAKSNYRFESDNVAQFARDCVIASPEKTPSAQIFRAYRTMCKENNSAPLGAKTFAHRLKIELSKLKTEASMSEKNERVGNYCGRVWTGIALSDAGQAFGQSSFGDPSEAPFFSRF